MTNKPERGSNKPCPICTVRERNQHTIRESAVCDGIKNGYLARGSRVGQATAHLVKLDTEPEAA